MIHLPRCLTRIILPVLFSFIYTGSLLAQPTQKDTLCSKVLGEDRVVWLHLPASYDDAELQPTHYPVIYLLDGAENFETVQAMLRFLGEKRFSLMPEAILVGIVNTDRTRDMTPSHATDRRGEEVLYESSGGLGNFLRFMEDELIPHVNGKYRTSDFRMLIGHSFGGLASVHTLLYAPQLFQAYVSIDPSLWWDNKVTVRSADSLFARKNYHHTSLYLALASNIVYNTRQTVHDFHYRAIKDFGENRLPGYGENAPQWRFKFYPDDNHGTIPIPATYDAFKHFFKEMDIPIKDIPDDTDILGKSYERLSSTLGSKILPSQKTYGAVISFVLERGTKEAAAKLMSEALTYYPQSTYLIKLKERKLKD